MNSWVLHGKNDLRYENHVEPTPKVNEVIVQIKKIGICGSDIHYFSHGRIGTFIPSKPFILGHEFSGIIVDLGHQVDSFSIGDRVAINPSHPCYRCTFCIAGRTNLCNDMKYFGSAATNPPTDGGLCEFIAVSVNNCYKISEKVNFATAALLEPLAVALHAITRAGNIAGHNVLISGAGTIGLLIATLVRYFGANLVVLTDLKEKRRIVAKQFADLVINPRVQDVASLNVSTVDNGFTISFEAAGASDSFNWLLHNTLKGGTLIQIGTLTTEVKNTLNLIMSNELQILGSFRFSSEYKTGIDLIESGHIKIDNLVSETFPLEQAILGFKKAVDDDSTIKIQIDNP